VVVPVVGLVLVILMMSPSWHSSFVIAGSLWWMRGNCFGPILYMVRRCCFSSSLILVWVGTRVWVEMLKCSCSSMGECGGPEGI